VSEDQVGENLERGNKNIGGVSEIDINKRKTPEYRRGGRERSQSEV